MDSNKDDAQRCLDMASAALEQGNCDKAARLVEKSRRMNPDLSDAQDRLAAAIKLASLSSSSSSTPSSSNPASASASASASSSAPTPDNNDGATHQITPQMQQAVKRVQKLTNESHYKVLGLEKGADEAAVKKAYRKLALQLHPDRNFARGADEAFKRVSAAFVILSDPAKREHYDQFGTDPDNPLGGAGAGGGGGGGMRAQHFTNGSNVFMNGVPLDQFFQTNGADDLFDMLFNGAGGGAGVRFNSSGVRFTQPRRRRRPVQREDSDDDDEDDRRRQRRRQQQAEAEQQRQNETFFERIKPMLYLLFFMFMSYWLSASGEFVANNGRYYGFSLQRSRMYTTPRVTKNNVQFYTNRDINVKTYQDEIRLFRSVDRHTYAQYKVACDVERDEETELRYRSNSWLATTQTREASKQKLRNFRKPYCTELSKLIESARRNRHYSI